MDDQYEKFKDNKNLEYDINNMIKNNKNVENFSNNSFILKNMNDEIIQKKIIFFQHLIMKIYLFKIQII